MNFIASSVCEMVASKTNEEPRNRQVREDIFRKSQICSSGLPPLRLMAGQTAYLQGECLSRASSRRRTPPSGATNWKETVLYQVRPARQTGEREACENECGERGSDTRRDCHPIRRANVDVAEARR